MEREEQVNLAAIMFTDIVGYTSLTESDEDLALKLLDEHRRIVRPLISSHNGKEVKTMGDAFLVEFGSAVESTRCAFEIQQALHKFNANRKPLERILLRIGIHLGDVIHSGEDVYGDAVNVASRIEGLSEPGGICISRQVYDSVRNKIHDARFESLGLRQLKNVKNEVEVYKAITPWGKESGFSYSVSPDEAQPRNRIVVLPFVNISQDPSDEFFADGLTEELISRLSQAKDLRVIARTSSMNYKNDRQKKIRDIGRELGAGIVIEGSVRKAGAKVRVTVQVVDAVNEEHLWASKYDRNLDDIFEIQTDIAERVADSFSSNLATLMRKQIRASQEREEAHDVTAYTYFLHGRHLMHGESEASVMQAIEFFNKAIEEDRTFARAYVGRAECYLSLTEFAHLPYLEASRKAEADIKTALELDPNLAEAHATLSRVKYTLDEIAGAEEEARKAVELNPSLSDAYHALGHLKWIRGQGVESIKLFETAYKLDPLKEENIIMLSQAYMDQGREKDALNLLSSVEHLFPQAAYFGLSWYHITRRDYAKATEFLEKFKLVAGSDTLSVLGLEGYIAAGKGEKERALELIARIEKSAARDTIANGIVGLIYYLLGNMDKFFEYMNRALEIHALPLGSLVNSPIYADARNDPRLKKLLEYYDFKIDLPAMF
ncbi:MAG TPA: adenylate/guanylate cyclase domain-containing protein [Nitrososphaerales archaeon]|nr:adenylate/guanylate cyclase domain-containing protein [Nitrososphaerales archaeon]